MHESRPLRPRLARRREIAALLLGLIAVPALGTAQEPTGEAPRGPARTLDFETWPDGSPVCDRCPLSEQYRSQGVLFEFWSRFTGPADPYLVGSGAYDPRGEETNHAVTAALTDEGFRPGVLTLRFPDGPEWVAFSLRGSHVVTRFAVRAFDREGIALADAAIARRDAGTYRASRGGRFREERISVESEKGIGRLELDGTGPPGHILLVDDLIRGRPAGPPAGRTPPRADDASPPARIR